MEKKRQAANMIVKPPPESEDSERDTGEESDIDTDEDKSRDNRCRLKHYRRQLNKLWESTMKIGKRTEEISEEWKIEHERLEMANNKLTELTKKYMNNNKDRIINKADAEILPRAQLASKIAKPKSSPKVAMPKHETNPTNVPMKTSETKKSFIVDPKQKKNIKPVQMSSKDEKKATFKKSTL
ncbi:uncharacterized protein LOC115768349 [Drosophila novamexicana]|uniref:uncharacterized protein LOC115768349 n=1 Tax=Drosophila novamexicana TaxID=47314 RepID=UPI0011E58DB7|nr:uncharacterized protein LOC115768349 [Drosophila novamexicana]